MGKKWCIFILALLIIASAGVLVFYSPPPPEPLYKGKPLSFWLQGYHPSRPPGSPTSIEAADAIKAIGTNAIPTLLRMLQRRDTRLETAFFSWLDHQSLIKIKDRHTPWAFTYIAAISGLEALGPKIGAAVPAFTKLYDEGSEDSQKRVLGSLALIGPPAADAVPLVLRALTNENPVIRQRAPLTLRRIHAQPGLVVPALAKMLNDPVPGVRGNAAFVLGGFGNEALSAVPALLALLSREKANSAPAPTAWYFFEPDGSSISDIVWSPWPFVPRPMGPIRITVSGCVERAITQIDPDGKERMRLNHQ